jgi:WD40 repeat protein
MDCSCLVAGWETNRNQSHDDGAIRFWDAKSGQEVLHYPIGYKINKVDWSHDGSKLLITYADKIIVLPVWQTTQELIDYAKECCVVRELSPEDRELYGLPSVK